MNKMIKEYRNSVMVLDIDNSIVPIELDKWGGKEYKISKIPDIKFNTCRLFIPYLTFKTLEKAYILKKFLIKNRINIESTIIGYCSYSRQERETQNEPELLSGILHTTNNLLGKCCVIDGHNRESFIGIETLSSFAALLQSIKQDYILVAPDKGAKARNKKLILKTDMCMNKKRVDGQVLTEIGEVNSNVKDNSVFVILDDICDGGRTFANAAEIIKKEYPNSKVILAITHAILPFGVDLLKEKGIDQIITVNTCFPEGEFFDGFLKVIDITGII